MTVNKVLLIDDEELIRISTKLCLEVTGGWEVLTATSGIEGLRLAEAEQPDAILLDVMMPDLDGLATFERLKANAATQHIPVFLLTAKVQAAEQRQWAALGVRGVIGKPFDPLTLADQIAETLAA